ncbi:hypothetical protein GCM10027516_43290 [Niabella aquatica]
MLILGGCEEVFEQDLSKAAIVLVAPSDSVVTGDTSQNFAWEHVGPLANYQLQIVSPRFDSIVILVADTITADNLVQVTLWEGRQYQWRVRAMNEYSMSPYSQPRTLTIQE